jgi:hypothetical protein
MIGGEEEPAGYGFRAEGGMASFPVVCVVDGVVSHAPIRHLPGWAGAMTVTSGDRAGMTSL